MTFYFKHIRHRFAKTNSSDLFFTSHFGNPMSSSYLGELMKRSFKRAVPGSVANPTRIRKMTSSLVAYETDDIRKQTTTLMTQSVATQQKSYTLLLVENTAKATRLLVNRRKKEAEKLELEQKAEEQRAQRENAEKETEEQEEIKEEQDVVDPSETSSARFQFTSEEQELLATSFSEFLSSNKFPSNPLVKARFSSDQTLTNLVQRLNGGTSRGLERATQKVVNMLKNFIREDSL